MPTNASCTCSRDLVSPERRGQALAGQPLTVFGDGKQTRSLCYVSDLVEGFLRLMERDQNDVAELVDHGSGRLHRVVDVVFWIVPDLGESRLRRRNHCTNGLPVGVALEEEIHEVFHLRRIFRKLPRYERPLSRRRGRRRPLPAARGEVMRPLPRPGESRTRPGGPKTKQLLTRRRGRRRPCRGEARISIRHVPRDHRERGALNFSPSPSA